MITRVWGIVNSEEIEFHPVLEQPGFWEGFAPRMPGLQDIEVWAENDKGARAHLRNKIKIEWDAITHARVVIAPYVVQLVSR